MLIEIQTGPLWEQFVKRHRPLVVETSGRSGDHVMTKQLMTAGKLEIDGTISYYLDRTTAPDVERPRWSIVPGYWAARESLWIERLLSPFNDPRKDEYRRLLREAQYDVPAE